MARVTEPKLRGTLEGKGRPLDATSTGALGLRATAALDGPTHDDPDAWKVRAEAVAYTVGGTVQMGGFPVLSLRLQAVQGSGGKAHGGVQASSTPALALWEGTPAEARDLSGMNGPVRQAQAARTAAQRLSALADRLEAEAREADRQAAKRGPDGAKWRIRGTAGPDKEVS